MSRPVSPVYSERVDHYRDAFARFARSREGDPGWLEELRREALERFAEIGFPSTRLEEWKYTNVAPIAKLALEPERESGVEGAGSLAEWLAGDPNALRARLARCPDPKDEAFTLLNTAFLLDGAFVSVPAGEDRVEPVHLRIGPPAAGRMRSPRLLVDVAAGARAVVVVEPRPGAHESLTNLVLDAEVGENAALELVIVQPGSEAGDDARFHVSKLSARVSRDGRFGSHTLTAGGSLVRNDLEVVLAGEGAECRLRGLFLGSGTRLVDNHTSVDHAVPHCTSRELYKGILGGRSKGIFRGRVLVRPDAQKTDASQSNPNLLLGEGAEIDTKPQLEIYADDVKCSHGATVGQLDADALFYLRSRGIGPTDARAMLTEAFANEILDAVPAPEAVRGLRDGLRSVLHDARSEARQGDRP